MEESMSKQFSSEQSNNNVLIFPGPRVRTILSVDDEAAKELNRRKYIDEVIETYAIDMVNMLAQQGFDIFNEDFDKHFGFTVEALRSTLLNTMGVSHPLQEVVKAAVNVKPPTVYTDFIGCNDDEDGDNDN
jgi:hypothetical protein